MIQEEKKTKTTQGNGILQPTVGFSITSEHGAGMVQHAQVPTGKHTHTCALTHTHTHTHTHTQIK